MLLQAGRHDPPMCLSKRIFLKLEEIHSASNAVCSPQHVLFGKKHKSFLVLKNKPFEKAQLCQLLFYQALKFEIGGINISKYDLI